MQDLGIIKNPIATHQLIKNVKDLILCKVTFLFLHKVFKSSIGTILHKNVIIGRRVTFERKDSDKVLMRR